MLAFLDAQDRVKPGPVGCVGHCMSGCFVTTVAARFASRFASAAALYGIGIVTDQPDSPHLLLPQVKGELYYAFAEVDPAVPADVIPALQAALERAGTKHTVKIVPGTHHGYQFAARADYNPDAAEADLGRAVRLVGSHLAVNRSTGVMSSVATGVEALVVLALAVDVAVTFANALLRYLVHRDLPWATDLSSILIPVIAFLGGAAFFRRSRGMAYTALLERLRGRLRRIVGSDRPVARHRGLRPDPVRAIPSSSPRNPARSCRSSASTTATPRSGSAPGCVLLVAFALERLVVDRHGTAPCSASLAAALVALLALALRHAYAAGLELDPFWAIAPGASRSPSSAARRSRSSWRWPAALLRDAPATRRSSPSPPRSNTASPASSCSPSRSSCWPAR